MRFLSSILSLVLVTFALSISTGIHAARYDVPSNGGDSDNGDGGSDGITTRSVDVVVPSCDVTVISYINVQVVSKLSQIVTILNQVSIDVTTLVQVLVVDDGDNGNGNGGITVRSVRPTMRPRTTRRRTRRTTRVTPARTTRREEITTPVPYVPKY